MNQGITHLRLLHDLSRQLAGARSITAQMACAIDALDRDSPAEPYALLIWQEHPGEPPLLQSEGLMDPAACDVVPRRETMLCHCLVNSGVIEPSALLEGAGLRHWSGYSLSAVTSDEAVLGVLGRRAELGPIDREFICAVGAILGTAIGMTRERHRAVEEERQRRRLARYLSPQVCARLAEEDFASICCGERVEAAILFSDICGFTRLSARLEPSQVVWMLNRYFSEMTAVVFQNGGMVDKFMGDGLMAVFGVPEPMTAPADAAIACARDILGALERLGLEFRDVGLPPLESGIGLHFGDAIFGAVGDGDYSDLTLIGSAVNLAARVESATRNLDARVLLTKDILDACIDPPPVSFVEDARLKGIPGTCTLYRPRWG